MTTTTEKKLLVTVDAYNNILKRIEELSKIKAVTEYVANIEALKAVETALRGALQEETSLLGAKVEVVVANGVRFYSYVKNDISYDVEAILMEHPDLYQQALEFSAKKAKDIPELNTYAKIEPKIVISSQQPNAEEEKKSRS